MNQAGLMGFTVVGAGVVLLPHGGWLSLTHLTTLFITALLLACGFLAWSTSRFHISLLTAIIALCGGALVSLWQVNSALSYRVSDSQIGSDALITVRIQTVLDERPRRQVMVAKTLNAPAEFSARRWRISWYGVPKGADGQAIKVKVGDEWQFTVRLRSLQGTANPGGFDVSAWHFRSHIDAVAYVRNSPPAILQRSDHNPSMNRWRADVAQRIHGLSNDNPYAGVVAALTLGIGSGVEAAFRDLLVTTGTAHLLAISGLHIGLVSAAAFLLLKQVWQASPVWLGQRYSRTGFAGLVATAVALLYAIIAGLSPSTLRAVGMCAVGFFIVWQRRSLSPWLPWSVALCCIVLSDVLRLLSPGVWLSFTTVALLIFLYQPRKPVTDTPSFRVPIAAAWRTHAALGICLLPITGWFFATGSLVAPLANLVAVPLVSFVVVPFSLLVVVLIDVWPGAAAVLLSAVNAVIGVLETWLTLCASIPFAGVSVIVPTRLALLTACLGVLCSCAPGTLGLRRFTVPLCLPVLVWTLGARSVDGLEVHVLDVGQGHASLVLTENHAVLVDTGGVINHERTHWAASVYPALKQLGRHQLTHIVISHSDADHAAAAPELVALFPNAEFWLGGLTTLDGVDANRCKAGERWQLDAVEFSFLHPASHDVDVSSFGQNLDDNNESCVLLVQYGQSTVLFPGDIEKRGEARLLARLESINQSVNGTGISAVSATQRPLALMQPLDVMIAPHHGSRSSSTADWVQAFRPKYVVFPAGHRNRSGFPHDDVLMRYKDGGSEPYVTGHDGALQFYFGPSGLRRPPTRYRDKNRRVWHLP